MDPQDVPDADRERIESLRAELNEEHAGPYATVATDDVIAYLLDLADAVDDPERNADPDRLATGDPAAAAGDSSEDGDGNGVGTRSDPFDRTTVHEQLSERNLKHSDPAAADRMDLYTIAAEFDVTGRSEMTKDELITAVIDRAGELAADPFAALDVDVDVDGVDAAETEDGTATSDVENTAGRDPDDSADSGSSQLDAMMRLLDTHDDKWREGDGDVRYEVDLPDGSVETARTKDDVRAILFRNY